MATSYSRVPYIVVRQDGKILTRNSGGGSVYSVVHTMSSALTPDDVIGLIYKRTGQTAYSVDVMRNGAFVINIALRGVAPGTSTTPNVCAFVGRFNSTF